MVLAAPVPPAATVRLLVAGERVKLGVGMTSVMFVDLVMLPEVPVTVATEVPGVAVLLAVKVSSLVLLVVAGLKTAVTPLGRFDAVKLTVGCEPLVPVTVILSLTVEPSAMLMLLAEEERVKPDGEIVRIRAVVLTSDPDVPVTVTA